MFPYRWSRAPFRNLRWFWYSIYYGVRNIIRWMPIVWRDDDCDWSYLAIMMEVKFRNMARLHRQSPIYSDNKKTVKQLMICAELCKRLHEEKYHDSKIVSRRQSVADEKRADQDSQLLGLMIGKHIRCWWY